MASELFDKWLAHYDSIHRGWTVRGIANGVSAMNGWGVPRVAGGYNLYRGSGSADAIDFTSPVGAAGRDVVGISNFAWRPHAVSTRYYYAVKSIGGGGVESEGSLPARVAEFDGGGGLIGLRPNAPTGLAVRATAGGAFALRWLYGSRLEAAAPSAFRIYHDAGTGTVDYNTLVASVPYVRGRAHFVYASAGFAHGSRRVWAVRAVTDEGVEDGNVVTAFGWADATAPPVHPSVRASSVEAGEGMEP